YHWPGRRLQSSPRLYEGGRVVNGRWRCGLSSSWLWWSTGWERRSSLYGLLGGRTRRHGSAGSGGSGPKGPSGGQTKSGATRGRSGCEGLVGGQHVPDRFGDLAGDVDLGDLAAALTAEAALVALVALAVDRVAQRVHGRFEHRPAQVLGALLGQRAAAIAVTGLIDPRAQAGVAAQLLGGREAVDVADVGGVGVGQQPADTREGDQP